MLILVIYSLGDVTKHEALKKLVRRKIIQFQSATPTNLLSLEIPKMHQLHFPEKGTQENVCLLLVVEDNRTFILGIPSELNILQHFKI